MVAFNFRTSSRKSAAARERRRQIELERLSLLDRKYREKKLRVGLQELEYREKRLRELKSSKSKFAKNFGKTESEVEAIALSSMTGGIINPVIMKQIGATKAGGAAIDFTAKSMQSGLFMIKDHWKDSTDRTKRAWKKLTTADEDLTEDEKDESYRDIFFGRKKSAKDDTSATEAVKAKNNPLLKEVTDIKDILSRRKSEEKKEEQKEEKSFLDLFKGAFGLLTLSVATGAIGSLFDNPILPAAIAGAAMGLKFGGLHGLVAGAVIGGAAGGILAASRDFSKRMQKATQGDYTPPSKIGPVTYAEFTGILAGGMAGMMIGGFPGLLAGAVLGYAITWLYEYVNNKKVFEEAGRTTVRNAHADYKNIEENIKNNELALGQKEKILNNKLGEIDPEGKGVNLLYSPTRIDSFLSELGYDPKTIPKSDIVKRAAVQYTDGKIDRATLDEIIRHAQQKEIYEKQRKRDKNMVNLAEMIKLTDENEDNIITTSELEDKKLINNHNWWKVNNWDFGSSLTPQNHARRELVKAVEKNGGVFDTSQLYAEYTNEQIAAQQRFDKLNTAPTTETTTSIIQDTPLGTNSITEKQQSQDAARTADATAETSKQVGELVGIEKERLQLMKEINQIWVNGDNKALKNSPFLFPLTS